MALNRGASHIITGSFPNLSSVCDYIVAQGQPVLLACSAWKDRVNIEDTLFAGAVIKKVRESFNISCDASGNAETLYEVAEHDLYGFLKKKKRNALPATYRIRPRKRPSILLNN